SLLNMFIHMPSPKRFELPDDVEPAIQQFLNKIDDMACPSGMKTNLYHYQKASLWKILQRELAPLQVPRPDVVELISVDGIKYYYHQLGGVATLTQGLQKDVPGGIICEDMGTGKTCICLAAIMATKQVLPSLQDVIIKTDFLEFYNNPQDNYGFKSLRTLAGIQTMLHSADWRSYRSQLPFEIASAFENSAPYYEWTPIQHHALIDRPHRQYLYNTVFYHIHSFNHFSILVPDNLVAQWTGEIYKHIHDGQLDFLVLDNKKHPIPEPLRLVQLDMVLISQSRFSHENSTGGFDFQGIPRECNCPYIGSTRTRNCTCPVIIDKPTYTSPLLQIHWKRVIVDEGHSLSARNSRQSNLSAKLFACWNWICTGTPTQNLTEVAILRTRQEGIADDLARLGILLGDILKLKPYASSKKLWPQFVVKPFILGKPWATNNVNNIMCRTMIRNQRSTIEHEVILPPLHCKTVELEFDYYQWLAHNCQISMINLNAILSKREGPDYLFSKNNQKALRETVSNLRQSCTWHSIDIQSLRSSYANCMEKLKQVDEGTEHYGADEPGLRQLKQLFELALGDPVFMDMMTKHEISFVVQGLPNLMKETWGWHKGARGAYMPVSANIWDDHCIVSGDIIVDLMHDVTNLKNANKNIYVYNSNTKILESTEVNIEQDDSTALTFYTRSVFTDVRVLCSTSSKINYLVDQILSHHTKEKCLIFSQYYNEMQEIYLALQLVKVRVLMYLDTSMVREKKKRTERKFI
ncbi:SNF2 family N-terminal domain-containing protein, partial [Halteromyces radiatus]|uniref:SNF2 family N-terminal domain-containing protein n=1 Tax=Halteromyces radiatus TaxID=101107 RepID=UPI00221EBC2E